MNGLYLHVPFCSALCPYCDFAVVVGRAGEHERYCDALVAEAEAVAFDGPVGTVFIGGGTPSLIEPGLLARTIDKLRGIVGWADDAEMTMEANPESLDSDGLRALRDAGVNRVSIGAQSFRAHVLRGLGRTHDVSQIGDAARAARAAGIDNLNLDLIYGGPGETTGDWRASLEAAIGLEPEHLSCYALTIEPRTAFGTAVERGSMRAPDDDASAQRFELACDLLGTAGYEHYEISNWSKRGQACAHNLVYWTQGDYLGLGLGAHSHRTGHRWWNTRRLRDYLADPATARAGSETLNDAQRADEWLELRLRLLEQMDLAEARAHTGRDLAPVARALEADGLAVVTEGRVRLTISGMLLENEVALRFLSKP